MENEKAKQVVESLSSPVSITLEGGVIAQVRLFQQAWDKDHSLQYVIEECLQAGVEAKRRSKEYSLQSRNRKAFDEAVSRDPSIMARPEDLVKLMQKHRIGATRSAA